MDLAEARGIVHCWADRAECAEYLSEEWALASVDSATCLLPAGHDGPHEWTPDEHITITFKEIE